ncbi:MAG: hypothetical protein SVU32_02320, partial [Candidatus Nanohaloarchaea archaeon]|nr:hypothetical protein [Candidatus Nanohaloarchaea archaeon]
HLYFKVVIQGERVNFSKDRYQLQARKVHLEGGNGEIVHVHADDVTLDFFLQTLGMRRNASCLSVDGVYCTNATHELRVYIGGNVSASPGDHELEQGENILLWYGRKGEKPDMRFFDRRLPRAYRPSSPGTKV